MDYLIWIIFVAAVFLAISFFLKGAGKKTVYSYSLLPTLLSPAERSFFGVLSQAVDDDALVFSKVRVADVLKPQTGMSRSNWQRAFNRISSKHFDFVLCNKEDLSIMRVVELNDTSHNSKKRQVRDKFLREVCDSASLPLIEVKAKRTYNVEDVRQQLSLVIRSN